METDTEVAETPETATEGIEEGGESLPMESDAIAVPENISWKIDRLPHNLVTLSDAEKQYLLRRSSVEAAMLNVEGAKKDLASAELVFEQAKESKKGKETALEIAWNELFRAERGEDDGQLDLFAGKVGKAAPAVPVASLDESAWDAKWNEFQAQGIDALDVSDGIKESLREHKPDGILTLKQLTSLKETNPVVGYCCVAGIGTGKADKLDDAYEKLLTAFLAANPQPKKPEASTQADDGFATGPDSPPERLEWDFVSTFPIALNPTENEDAHDASYHREIINRAAEEKKEIDAAEEIPRRRGGENGTPLSKKEKTKLETKLGDTKAQYAEVFRMYGETFGQAAADAMKRYIERSIVKQASLKGGL